jgi:hypothetical protein
MKTLKVRLFFFTALVLVLLAFVPAVRAAGDSLGLNWWTVAGGGGTSSGGIYALSSTAGQAGPGVLQGGVYILQGGFWPGGEAPLAKVFLPLIRR